MTDLEWCDHCDAAAEFEPHPTAAYTIVCSWCGHNRIERTRSSRSGKMVHRTRQLRRQGKTRRWVRWTHLRPNRLGNFPSRRPTTSVKTRADHYPGAAKVILDHPRVASNMVTAVIRGELDGTDPGGGATRLAGTAGGARGRRRAH